MFFREMVNGSFNRYDIAVRYLAIENYFGANDFGFELYRKMQERRIASAGFGEQAVSRFKELLQSYQAGGYDKTSRITLDKTLGLVDGSHRIAANIYFHEPMISALSLGVDNPVDYSIDWFIGSGFTHAEIDTIKDKAAELAESLNAPFECIVWSPAVKFADEIAEDLKYYGEVLGVRHYHYSEAEYANIVRAVYAIDDIAKWKIEKKIEHMSGSGGNIAVIPLRISSPAFRVKAASGLPLSAYLERVKKAVRTRYKAEIPNYFHDICFHVGDNYMQNNYISHIFNPDINMSGMIGILSRYEYAFTKTEVPYLPEDFPERIPVGKDADIFCSAESLAGLIEKTEAWCRNTPYDVRVIAEESGSRIRMELYGRLIYQIDIACEVPELGSSFVSEALAERKHNGKFYVLSPAYEYIYRLKVYAENNSKGYHLEYLQKHREDYDQKLAEKYHVDNIV